MFYIVTVASSGSEGGSIVDMSGVQLGGEENRSKRFRIYSFMMETFTEEQKIQATAKLVHEILSHAIERGTNVTSNNLSARPSFESAVHDALLILQSPLLKIGKNNSTGTNTGVEDVNRDEEDVEESVSESISSKKLAAVTFAKNKVLRKLSKQHLVEQVLPILCSLKHTLESSRSVLQKPLMEYLMHLVKTSKAEVDVILSTDPALKAEIEYDMKMFVREKQAREVNRSMRDLVNTESKSRANQSRRTNEKLQRHSLSRLSLVDSCRRASISAAARSSSAAEKYSSLSNAERLNTTGDLMDRLAVNVSSSSPSIERRWSVSINNFSASDINTDESNKGESSISQLQEEPLESNTPETLVSSRPEGSSYLHHSSPVKKRSKRSTTSGKTNENQFTVNKSVPPLESESISATKVLDRRSRRGSSAAPMSLLNLGNSR